MGGKKVGAESELNPTIVVEAVRDLVSDDHSYSAKVEGLVLMFAEERRLQDSCWKNLSEKKRLIKATAATMLA